VNQPLPEVKPTGRRGGEIEMDEMWALWSLKQRWLGLPVTGQSQVFGLRQVAPIKDAALVELKQLVAPFWLKALLQMVGSF